MNTEEEKRKQSGMQNGRNMKVIHCVISDNTSRSGFYILQ